MMKKNNTFILLFIFLEIFNIYIISGFILFILNPPNKGTIYIPIFPLKIFIRFDSFNSNYTSYNPINIS
mgnify:CR=1 FL=1